MSNQSKGQSLKKKKKKILTKIFFFQKIYFFLFLNPNAVSPHMRVVGPGGAAAGMGGQRRAQAGMGEHRRAEAGTGGHRRLQLCACYAHAWGCFACLAMLSRSEAVYAAVVVARLSCTSARDLSKNNFLRSSWFFLRDCARMFPQGPLPVVWRNFW